MDAPDDKNNTTPTTPAPRASETPADPARRLALRRLGGYAMSVAPAMVLLSAGRGRGGGGDDGESAGGRGGGRGDPQAPCDNPAWQLGLKRAGHSGC